MAFDREARRLALQSEFEELVGDFVARMDDGSPAILFQPPENVKLRYPCVIYNYDSDYFRHADDKGYYARPQYEITVIEKDPDSMLWTKIAEHFDYCRHNRRFTADNLYHDVLGLYY
jgi:hypothetical protein